MRIQIKDPYIGHDTQGQRIWPGEYDIHDPQLFGVGQSLVDTGYAVVLYEPPVVAEEAPADSGEAEPTEPEAANDGEPSDASAEEAPATDAPAVSKSKKETKK